MKPLPYAYYILIDAKSSEVHMTSEPDEPTRLRDRNEAGRLCDSLNDAAFRAAMKAGKKKPSAIWQVHGPFTDDRMDWKKREAERLASGFYKPLHPELYRLTKPDHFAHVAMGDPKALAYTPGRGDGIRDVQKRLAVTTYLERWHPEVGQNEVQRLLKLHMEHVSVTALDWAMTADEIIRAYTHFDPDAGGGPASSCMRHGAGHFQGHVHPVAVYGDSDLCLALLRDERGRTAARAIVWKEKMIYSRVYGNSTDDAGVRLQRLLETAGYKKSRGYYDPHSYPNVSEHNLVGAKIRAIKDKRRGRQAEFIMPYVDECSWGELTEDKQFFILRRDRPAKRAIGVQSTSGVAEYHGFSCPICGNRCCDDTPMRAVAVGVSTNGGDVEFTTLEACPQCIQHHSYHCAGYHCAGYDRLISSRHSSPVMIGAETYSTWYAERNFKRCHQCGSWSKGDLIPMLQRHRKARTHEACDKCVKTYAYWDAELQMLMYENLMIPASIKTSPKDRHVVREGVTVPTGISWLSPLALTYDGGLYEGMARAMQAEHADPAGKGVRCMLVDLKTGVATHSPDGVVHGYPEALVALSECDWRKYRIALYDENAGPPRLAVGTYVEVEDVPVDVSGARGSVRGVITEDKRTAMPYTVKLDNGYVLHAPFAMTKAVEGAPPKEYPAPRRFRMGDEVFIGDRASGRYGYAGVVLRVEKGGETNPDLWSVAVQLSSGSRTVYHKSLILLRPVEEVQAANRAKGFMTTPTFTTKMRGRVVQPNEAARGYGIDKKYVGMNGVIKQIMSSAEALIRMENGQEFYLMPRHVNLMLTPEELGQEPLPIDEKPTNTPTRFQIGQRVRILPEAKKWDVAAIAVGKEAIVEACWTDDDFSDGSDVKQRDNFATATMVDDPDQRWQVRLIDVELVSDSPRGKVGDRVRFNMNCMGCSIPRAYAGTEGTVVLVHGTGRDGAVSIRADRDNSTWGAGPQHYTIITPPAAEQVA